MRARDILHGRAQGFGDAWRCRRGDGVVKKTVVTLCLALFVAAGCSGRGEPDAVPTSTGATVETTTAADQPPGVAEDLNDVGGPLDLERATAVRTGDLLAVSITTYEAWEDDLLTGLRIDKQGRIG